MEDERLRDFLSKLKNLHLSQLLKYLESKSLEEEFRTALIQYICKNYTEIPVVKLHRSIDDLNNSSIIPDKIKSGILNARYCANEIIERLEDLSQINNLDYIKTIVYEQIEISKNSPMQYTPKL